MKILACLLLVAFVFTSTASYAAACCYKEQPEAQEMDCHKTPAQEQTKQNCAFDCGVNISAKYFSDEFISSSSVFYSEKFDVIAQNNFASLISKTPQRPPKQSV